jgi:hypothetical protein
MGWHCVSTWQGQHTSSAARLVVVISRFIGGRLGRKFGVELTTMVVMPSKFCVVIKA